MLLIRRLLASFSKYYPIKRKLVDTLTFFDKNGGRFNC
ncbi:hypothetical protein PSPO_b1061 [Pseudoalteromonas spongiae UST010723-006]|nr:hypothetical protein PSPO_b1061 [Pseudoalteromonas spongiae UST010723-006]